MRAIVIGGATSGVGKTTIATGLMGALVRRGIKVQPFKTGPDYIDPSYHTWVTGVPSRNLDTWMLSQEAVLELFHRAMTGKDIGVIEGVMGLYDGHSSTSDEGSTAELAKLLNVPVVLIVDARNGARSVAAIVKGYQVFDSSTNIAGVILNGIGSEGHFKICGEAIEHHTGVKVLGYLPRRGDLVLPERHLGLIPTVEGPAGEAFKEALISQCEATLDIDAILRLSEQADPPQVTPSLFPPQPAAPTTTPTTRIAIARDKAFSFYYQDSLDLLEAWGAELVSFSPIQDSVLPENADSVYLGGGFPEMYAEELAANVLMKTSIKKAAETGMPIYGECGGLMYLGSSITDLNGKEHAMTGILPVRSGMNKRNLSLGYRTVTALADGPLLRKGEMARAHEFHWSNMSEMGNLPPAYSVEERDKANEGFQVSNVLASYIHMHLGSRPSMAPRFVEVCRHFREAIKNGAAGSTP